MGRNILVNKNTANRKCKIFHNPEVCSLIQPDCNCYQCPIFNFEICEKDLLRAKDELEKLKKENQTLKILLADKIIAENKGLVNQEEGIRNENIDCH